MRNSKRLALTIVIWRRQRSRHLRFFLLLAAGLIALFGYLVNGKNQPSIPKTGVNFIGGLIMVLLQLLDTITFVTVRRLQEARLRHEEVKRYVRRKLSRGDRSIAKIWDSFGRRRGLSVQSTIEFTLHLFAVILFQAAVFIFATQGQPFWQCLLVLAFTNILFIIHILVFLHFSNPEDGKCNK